MMSARETCRFCLRILHASVRITRFLFSCSCNPGHLGLCPWVRMKRRPCTDFWWICSIKRSKCCSKPLRFGDCVLGTVRYLPVPSDLPSGAGPPACITVPLHRCAGPLQYHRTRSRSISSFKESTLELWALKSDPRSTILLLFPSPHLALGHQPHAHTQSSPLQKKLL